MSLAIVESIRAKYPTPLGDLHDEFLEEVANALGMGLLKKTGGTVIAMADGTTVAQDIVMAVPAGPTAPTWDILFDGENKAIPIWNQSDVQPTERFYAVAGSVPPEPVPPTDLAPIYARLNALEAELDALRKSTALGLQHAKDRDLALDTRIDTLPKVPTVAVGSASLSDVVRGRELRWKLE